MFTSTVLYSFVGLMPSVVNFFLLPIYLTIIPVEQYGVYLLVNSFSAMLGVVMGLKLESAYRAFYFDQKNGGDKERYLSTLFTFILIVSSVISAIAIFFGEFAFKNLFGSDVVFFPFGLLGVMNVFLASINVLYVVECQSREDRKAYVLYSLGGSAIAVCLQYVGIVVFGFGILSMLVSVLISGCMQFLFVVFIAKFRVGRMDREKLRGSLKYSLPLIPFLFLLTAEQQLDRYFLKTYYSLESLGIYALLVSVSGLLSILLNSLDNAIRPSLFQKLDTSDPTHDIKYYQQVYVSISMAAVVAVAVLAYVLPHWIGNLKYLSLLDSIPLFVVSLIPLIYVRYYAVLFSYKKDSNNLTFVSLFKLPLLAAVFYALVPTYGIDGILLSLFVANLVNAVIFYILIKHKHGMSIVPTRDVAWSLGICACIFFYWTQSL